MTCSVKNLDVDIQEITNSKAPMSSRLFSACEISKQSLEISLRVRWVVKGTDRAEMVPVKGRARAKETWVVGLKHRLSE